MDIKIVDNFLDPIDLKKVQNYTFTNPHTPKKWKIQQSNVEREDASNQFLECEASDDEYFNTYLWNKVKKHLDGNYKLERVYFNGQWSGREGQFHDDGCDITALLYLNDYEYGWGGFTEIMTSPKPTVIHPLLNRLVFFPGRTFHKGYSFCYQSCPMRLNLAYKIIH